MLNRIQGEIEANRELEKRLAFMVEQRTSDLRAQLAAESKQRFQSVENIKQMTVDGITSLNDQYEQNCKTREEIDSDLFRRIDEESNKFMEIIAERKKAINESEEAMLEILRDMILKIKSELDNEKKEREEIEETLLTLLEDT